MYLHLALALGLAGLLQGLLAPSAEEPGRGFRLRRFLGFLTLAALCFQCLGWLEARLDLAPEEFHPGLSPWQGLSRLAQAAALGGLGFSLLRPGLKGAGLGLLAGLVFSALGYWAFRSLGPCAALRLLGSFWGSFFWVLGSWLLALSILLASLALISRDLRSLDAMRISSAASVPGLPRPGLDAMRISSAASVPGLPRPGLGLRLAIGLILAWAVPVKLVERHLRAAWGYGPRSLGEAAGLAPEAMAERRWVAWLKPSGERPYLVASQPLSGEGVSLSREGLERLEAFLKARGLRSVFARKALRALRGGWRLHWEAERALAADRLALPGLIVPGYLGALALIRAGPLTPARFQKLEELSLLAQERREGFESARGAQLIYEAFSAAYARFGQEAGARSWIYKIDRLWPIYEKKIEVSPLEDFREGLVEGWVLEGDRPALSVRVGLFWIPPGGPASPGTLSASVLPDPGGRFRFAGLGAGQYYLGLMGPNRFPGRILGSPGVIRFSEAFPAVTLPPIRLLGARSLRPRPP